MNTLVTAKQLAELLNVDEMTIRRWYWDGKIPVIRLSPRCVRFDYNQVMKALNRQNKKLLNI